MYVGQHINNIDFQLVYLLNLHKSETYTLLFSKQAFCVLFLEALEISHSEGWTILFFLRYLHINRLLLMLVVDR